MGFFDAATLAEMQAIEEDANTARLDLYSMTGAEDAAGGRRRVPTIVAAAIPCRLGLVSPLELERAGQSRAANQYRVTVPLGTEIPAESFVHVTEIDRRPADLWLRVLADDRGRSYATRLRLVCEVQTPPHVDEALA